MALYAVANGDVAMAQDVNQIKEVLEGLTSEQFALIQAAGANFIVRLPDSAGAYKFSIQDSGSNEVASIDSNGVLTVGGFSPATLIIPGATSPSQTAEGSAVWDTDNDVLTIGTGAGRKVLGPSMNLVGSNTAVQTTTSTSAVDLVAITVSPTITVDQTVFITGTFSKDASAAQSVALGLKLNSTTVIEAAVGSTFARSSGTQQVEDGSFCFWIAPRDTGYLSANGTGSFVSNVSATGAAAQAHTLTTGVLTALFPNDTYTSVTIRAINGTSSNNVAVKDVRIYAG